MKKLYLIAFCIISISCGDSVQCKYAKAQVNHWLKMDSLMSERIKNDTTLTNREKMQFYPRTDWITMMDYLDSNCD